MADKTAAAAVKPAKRAYVTLLGCVVREVQPVYPPDYNRLRVWEFVEYDQMMYLDATGFQGSLENIHKQFEPNGGPPPAACADADMFVYNPSMATARLLLHAVGIMMRMSPRTTDLVMMSPRTTVADDHVMMSPRTTADHQQGRPAADSSVTVTQQPSK